MFVPLLSWDHSTHDVQGIHQYLPFIYSFDYNNTSPLYILLTKRKVEKKESKLVQNMDKSRSQARKCLVTSYRIPNPPKQQTRFRVSWLADSQRLNSWAARQVHSQTPLNLYWNVTPPELWNIRKVPILWSRIWTGNA